MMRMEKRIDKLEEKIDVIIDKLHQQNLTLVRNTESLEVHEKRTDIAEQKLGLLEKEFIEHSSKDDLVLSEINTKLTPIYKHVNVVNVILKYVLPALAGLITFLLKIGFIKIS